MKVKRYRVGVFQVAAFASLAGTSAKVLRDYDAAGIFRPAWIDPASGYRRYSAAQLPALRRVLALRDLGVSLDEIRRLVEDRTDLASVLQQRREALDQARRELERRLAAVGIELDGTIPGVTDVVVRELRPELVGILDVRQAGGDDGRAFYELERAIRDAAVRAPRPPAALVHGRPDGGAERVEVVVPIRRAVPGAFAATTLPAVRAATAIHHGPYATLERTRRALLAWIAAAGFRARSPIRVVYLQFGAEADLRLPAAYLIHDRADQVTELQVPVD